MGKIWVEICLISARGLRRKSSLWKLQWFAVGWIDPDDKYCTKIDASGNANPVWKTKFSRAVDPSESKYQDLALHVEVYSREPIFLRESLLGSTTIVLKEFLDKYDSKSDIPKPVEEVGSFQLRKKNSNKPLGFVDVSIRISGEKEEYGSSYLGGINLSNGHGSLQSPRPHMPQPESRHHMQVAFPPNYSYHPPVGGGNYPAAEGPSYPPPRTPPPPPPPPPPSNAGYIPSFYPMANNSIPSSYINMPASVAPPPGRGVGPVFGMGVGAGALAAGAVMFGDDFFSGFDVPGASRDATVTVSTYPPF
ncbi:hypothetical protein CDL12_00272 [Handroanthus impetiginosus]|uniref:C2 domain-containing protein n=1 Tax=Handroanthus impetiginosus TaxID=429701 RepID=A0A2G9GI17_9LAMI|nr:hypothetical protein CDL12_22529 [Handroanthus impetiginosus]PIN26964.1 hypothetical protein CDL12_00272 [Handroanthus impetiginosus]